MTYQVLVVDDSKTIRAMVKKSIALSGLPVGEVFEAGTGREALAVLGQHWVDIVFADVHMPDMNGIELVEAMSKDAVLGKVPVVIVSSDRNQSHISRLEELGIRAYVKKPFRPESFREVVQCLLGQEEEGDP